MPFLLPAPDFTPEQLQNQRITGTCEVQICRSVGPWSMGISHTEHSIQNAYIKCIQLSDHFVYIEVRVPFERLSCGVLTRRSARRTSSSSRRPKSKGRSSRTRLATPSSRASCALTAKERRGVR